MKMRNVEPPGGDRFPRTVFERTVLERAVLEPLDGRFLECGEGSDVSVALRHTLPLAELLTHPYVLIPAFDGRKHSFVGGRTHRRLTTRAGQESQRMRKSASDLLESLGSRGLYSVADSRPLTNGTHPLGPHRLGETWSRLPNKAYDRSRGLLGRGGTALRSTRTRPYNRPDAPLRRRPRSPARHRRSRPRRAAGPAGLRVRERRAGRPPARVRAVSIVPRGAAARLRPGRRPRRRPLRPAPAGICCPPKSRSKPSSADLPRSATRPPRPTMRPPI